MIENAAKVIVEKCLGVKKGEKVLVVTDRERLKIGGIILEAAEKITDNAKLIEIPVGVVSGEEPSKETAEEMKGYDVIIAPTTKSLTHTNAFEEACAVKARGATLPGITEEIMEDAIDVNYIEMAKLTNRVGDVLNKGKEVHVTTEAGTDIRFSIDGRTSKPDTGLIHEKGLLGNLPAGEAFISPVEGTADGNIVIDASILGMKIKEPIRVAVEKGFAVKINGGEEAERLKETLEGVKDKNAFNIAELGIGTNAKARIIGNTLEDEKVLGTAHIAFGKNSVIGGTVDVPVHIDGVFFKPTIYVDGKKIISDGVILI